MKNFTLGSILALSLLVLSACAPANQSSGVGSDTTAAGTAEGSNNIIGGTVVVPGSPLAEQVFMLYGMTNTNQTYLCTATLITRQHVLTAAHCVEDFKWMVAIFSIDAVKIIRQKAVLTSPDVVPVSGGAVYPGYRGSKGGTISGTDAGDIAILKLAKPAPAKMKVTKLVASSRLQKGQAVVASGYGINSGTLHTGSGLLRETRVPVDEPLIGRSEFAVNQEKGTGICSGDSGGPSFVVSPFGAYEQIGVTSRGDEGCAQGGIYTLVPAFRSWIEAVVNKL